MKVSDMSRTDDVLRSAKYVVDKEGKQTAVLLDLTVWQQVLHFLEELDEDEHLGQLMMDVARDEKLEAEDAVRVYQEYLTNSDS
jgi:hypothetical protein